MSALPNYKDMRFYQAAIELVVLTYGITKTFPKNERYNLISQMNRSSDSIPSNIAEGAGRDTIKQLFQFMATANGSLCELDTQYDLAKIKGYLDDDSLKRAKALIAEVAKTMWGYRKWLEAKSLRQAEHTA